MSIASPRTALRRPARGWRAIRRGRNAPPAAVRKGDVCLELAVGVSGPFHRGGRAP